ncbi:MAG: hypothetical protein NTZ32_01085 [Planctomycetales bacterium]|nr:hypothetical protein [Planctomycetales bacterium]
MGAVISVGLLWAWSEQAAFRVNVVFADGSGLGVDSPVYVRGARVSQLRFDNAGKIQATLAPRRDAADHLYNHTLFFTTREQYLTGPACVAVYTPSDGQGHRLRAGDTVTAVSGLPETLIHVVLPQIENFATDTQSKVRRLAKSRLQ